MTIQSFAYEPVIQHRDARGTVVEPISGEGLQTQANSHVVLTAPGCVRGNHYHPRGEEVTVVFGPSLVRVRLTDGIKDIQVPDGEAYRFYFPAGVPHAIKNNGTIASVMVAFNTVAHDLENSDVVADVLIS